MVRKVALLALALAGTGLALTCVYRLSPSAAGILGGLLMVAEAVHELRRG